MSPENERYENGAMDRESIYEDPLEREDMEKRGWNVLAWSFGASFALTVSPHGRGCTNRPEVSDEMNSVQAFGFRCFSPCLYSTFSALLSAQALHLLGCGGKQ